MLNWKSYAGAAFVCALAFNTGNAFSQAAQTQSIKLSPVSDQTYGVAPFQVLALASSNLPVTLSVGGPATLNGRLLTITGPGTVTISAHQAGNSVYGSADAQETFTVNPGVPVIAWNPGPIIYGTPLDSSILNASATAIPAADPSADIATVTWQLNSSAINDGSSVTVPDASSVFRYEGAPMMESPFPNDAKGMIPDPALVANHMYRVAFTCDCQEFEFVVQTRQGSYRIWVDGSWLTDSEIAQQNDYPRKGFYKVAFPDKRPRQIRIGLTGVPPFFGLVTHPSDAVSPPQAPLGPRVIIFGDSWTGPTIVQPALPPPQPGGTGYAQVLGEYFNWDWWEDGQGSTGFANPGKGITFDQRAQTDICGRNPDAVLVMGGINDSGFGEPAIEQAVTQFLSDVESCVPNAKIYFSGPQFTITDVSAGIHAAVAKFSNVYYGDPGAENWFYGSPTDPTIGNAYLYLNSHPTPLGHDYWAEKEAQFILNGFPALAPQTFSLFDSALASGTFNYSVVQQTILPAGPHEISVTFTPQDDVNYATVTQKATLTVEKAATSVSLSSSASSISPGSAVTLTSTVTPQIGGVPTGAVTFLDNGNAIGTGVLDQSGTASFSTSSLAIGTHSITASFSGDENFFGSMSSQSVPVVVVKPDFSFSINSTQLTVAPTQSGTVTVTVTPISGLVANLNLGCSGLPANATCSLANEDHIVVNNQITTAIVTVNAFAPRTTASARPLKLGGIEVCALLGIFFVLRRRNRRALSGWVAPALLLFAALGVMSGCGSNSKIITATPGTYSVQLTLSDAADATITHSQSITVVIP